MKKQRQAMIIELVETYVIETQEDLAYRLKEAGVLATQATISRDIRELRLTKLAIGNGKQKYVILKDEENYLNDKLSIVLKEGYVSMDCAQNILVIKTISGMAMAVAAAIDAMRMTEIVGCIAGDDTIMAAIRTTEDTSFVMGRIKEAIRS